jgi:DNA-binding FadR family transcriptional regulator
VIAVDRRQVAATLQVRAALESLGSGLAAARVRGGRAIPEELRRLDDLARAAARAEAPDRDLLADRNLHRAIVALGGNQPCRDALNHVWDRLLVASAHGALPVHEGAAADREHRELLAAVAAGDEGEASAVARRHALAALG